jgi:hypothetical protein
MTSRHLDPMIGVLLSSLKFNILETAKSTHFNVVYLVIAPSDHDVGILVN